MRDKTAWLTAGLLPLFLAGCTTGDPSLGVTPPRAIVGAAPDNSPGGAADLAPAPGQTPALQPAQVQPAPTEVRAAAGRSQAGPIQFLPLVGAPEEKVVVLSQALGQAAGANGVALAPSQGPVAPQRLKGYLSVLVEGRETVVIYVWDVVDPQGIRLGRIQGQQRIAAANPGDPWSVVDGAALSAIAATTMQEFRRTASARG